MSKPSKSARRVLARLEGGAAVTMGTHGWVQHWAGARLLVHDEITELLAADLAVARGGGFVELKSTRPTPTPPASRDLNTPATPQAVPSSAIPAGRGGGVPAIEWHLLVRIGGTAHSPIFSGEYRCGLVRGAAGAFGTVDPTRLTCPGCKSPAEEATEKPAA